MCETIAKADDTVVQTIASLLETKYFWGLYQGDVQLLKEIFDERTLLFGDVKNHPYAKRLDEYLAGVAQRVAPKDSGRPFKAEVITIDVINSIAVAKVKVRMYDFNYYDFLSLHKQGNDWKIVHKLLTHLDD